MTKRHKIRRINTRGPRHGQCNICGEIGPLTEDHTPPKSCRGIAAAELHSLHDKLSAEGDRWYKPRHFQAGICYRSLCERCNGLLGNRYDPALAEMAHQVREIARSPLKLPAEIGLEISPGPLLRSVLGHLAAQAVERPLQEMIRGYVLDDTQPFPATLRMYYWFYPFRRQVLIRDAASIKLNRDAVFGFWLMKFFPLAFYVTFDEPLTPLFNLPNFDAVRDVSYEARYPAYVRIQPLVNPEWPERPNDDEAILYGQQAMIAEPLRRRPSR